MYSNLIIIAALLVTISPFLGFPSVFKNPFYFLIGLAIAYLAFHQKNIRKKSAGLRRVYRKPKNAVTLEVKGSEGESPQLSEQGPESAAKASVAVPVSDLSR